MTVWIAVMLAGALGSVTRFVVDGAVKHRWSTTFPAATFLINVAGSLLIGFVAGEVLFNAVPTELKAVVGTGFCGGFTTFSTASFETVRLVTSRQSMVALGYALASVVSSVLGCAIGLYVAWLL